MDVDLSNLEFHEAADLFPMLEGQEYEDFKADIAARGQRHDIEIWRGKILDGRNRYRACKELKLFPNTRVVVGDWDPVDYVLSANLQRRHLTTKQKREVIAKVLKHHPERSNNRVGKQLGVSDKTVGQVRRDLEAGSEITNLAKVRGADGKEQAARKRGGKNPAATGRRVGAGAREEGVEKSPEQLAKENPEYRWTRLTHDLLVHVNSVRNHGGIEGLTKGWTRKARLREAEELQGIVDTLSSYITYLRAGEK